MLRAVVLVTGFTILAGTPARAQTTTRVSIDSAGVQANGGSFRTVISADARSAALGDTIPVGATRHYQIYYRDPNLAFCPGGFNVTHAIAIAWGA